MRYAAAEASGLVGRERELAELRAALDESRLGRGHLVLVSGDAGIGKTRLVEALCEQAGPTEVRTCWGRCWEGGAAAAFWPWRQVLRACTAAVPGEALARQLGADGPDVALLAPELTGRLEGLGPAEPIDSPQGRIRLFDAVGRFLAAVAAEHGGLIVPIEDIHVADEASLQLLRRLARNVATTQLLVIATYRDAEVRSLPERQRLVDSLGGHGPHLALAGLDRDGVAALLERSSGRAPTADVVSEVHRVTEGNPFFVSEVARLLAAEGRSRGIALPEEIHALIRRRLEPLAEPVRAVLSRAAVLGQQFDLPVLRRLGISDHDVLDALAEAGDLRVVEEVALGRWVFSHSLLRETLYDQLPHAERAALHLRAGRALEELFAADLDPHLAQLAHHFSAATGQQEKALSYCTRAAQSAMATLAFEDAASWYRRALGHAAADEPRARYDLLMACAEAEWRSSGFGKADGTLRQAIRAARNLGSGDLLGCAVARMQAPDIDLLEEALRLQPDNAEVAVRHALMRLIREPENADVWLSEARAGVDAARRSADRRVLSDALWWWHRALHADSHGLAERLDVSAEMLRAAIALGDLDAIFRARGWRMDDLFEAGDVPGLRKELDVLAADARRSRLQYYEWVVAFMRTALALHAGRVDEADRLAHQALSIGEATESGEVDDIFACQLHEIRRQQGRFEELEAVARRAVQQFPRYVQIPLNLALALAESGRHAAATDALDRSPAARDPASLAGEDAVSAWIYLADVTWVLRDAARAPVLYDLLLPYAGRHVTLPVVAASIGSVDLRLGTLATVLERWDAAEAHFQAAHRIHERIDAKGWLAHGRTAHARMLLARGRVSEAPKAVELLTSARDGFRELGNPFYEQRAAGLLAEAPRAGRAATFVAEDGGWVIQYDGAVVRLHATVGLNYLACLLASPGREFAVTELVDRTEGITPEQARHRVTRALKSSIARIAEAHPELGEHLGATVRVGMSSSYRPDPRSPVAWSVEINRG